MVDFQSMIGFRPKHCPMRQLYTITNPTLVLLARIQPSQAGFLKPVRSEDPIRGDVVVDNGASLSFPSAYQLDTFYDESHAALLYT